MAAGTWSSADSVQQLELPKLPMKVGAKTLGWTLDGQTICTAQDIINSIDGSSIYREIRALYEDIIMPVTVTVVNNIDDSITVLQGNRGKNLLLEEEIKNGYRVAWWALDSEGKEKLGRSYLASQDVAYCYVYPSHDITVYAHYVPEEENPPQLSAIEISGAYPVMLDEGPHIMTIAARNISKTDTVKSHGMLTAFNGDVQEETAE